MPEPVIPRIVVPGVEDAPVDVGDLVRLVVVFEDAGMLAVDPSVVRCKLQTPDRAESVVVATRDTLGHYHADITVAKEGVHVVRWEGDGTFVGASERSFVARHTEFGS